MPLAFEEDDEQRADREAEEKRDALFRRRLMAAAEKARILKQQEQERIRQAMEIIETADPEMLAAERYRRAIGGVDLRSQQCAPPSLAGQTKENMELLARQEASREQAWRNEQASRKRWVESQEEVIKALQSGQSEDNQRLIRAQFMAQKGGS